MTSELSAREPDYVHRALEVSIHIGLIILLVAACLVILRPFLPLVVWGIIVAISVYPGYGKLQRAFGAAEVWRLWFVLLRCWLSCLFRRSC